MNKEKNINFGTKSVIVAIEGFDMVGKDYVLNNAKKFGLPPIRYYRPEYTLFDSMFTRNDAWVIGYAIIDYISQGASMSEDSNYMMPPAYMGFNRSIVSSLVYSELYGGTLHSLDNLKKIYDYYNYNSLKSRGVDVQIYHISHYDEASAMKIMMASKDRDINEALDNFDTFDAYWMMYSDAEKLFRKFYNFLGYTDHVKFIKNKYEG